MLGGTSFTTTAPAPIVAPLPIVMLPIMQTFGPIVTSSSIIGDFSALSKPLAPIVVFKGDKTKRIKVEGGRNWGMR